MQEDELRYEINLLLNTMKVEEYGITPQTEVLEGILDLIKQYSKDYADRIIGEDEYTQDSTLPNNQTVSQMWQSELRAEQRKRNQEGSR